MRWRTGRRSQNIEDLRGRSGGGRRRMGVRGGMVGIIIGIIAILMGADPRLVMGLLSDGSGGGMVQSTQTRGAPSAAENELADFTRVVLADTEDTWHPLFKQIGKRYREPKLVLFTGSVRSACGGASSAMGPFYCPADQKVYIDLSFYNQLKRRHNAPGDFAQAYVIAHEVGHHVQQILGISNQVRQAQARMGKVQANELSVRQELQADCFSGVWAHHADKARAILETGDVEEALQAASQIGDDTLQRQSRGYVQPESFTHGTAAQRVRWFKKGLREGSIQGCDTFQARTL